MLAWGGATQAGVDSIDCLKEASSWRVWATRPTEVSAGKGNSAKRFAPPLAWMALTAVRQPLSYDF